MVSANRLELLQIADDAHEAPVPVATQEGIEFGKFAALALTPHPALFGSVPRAWPMQQKEAFAAWAWVFVVQRPDTFAGQVE